MLHMFVVDDEQIERDGIMSFCDWQDLGISIIGEARNGKVALEALRGKRVDIIVSDVKMPIMDGLQFAAEIKKIQPDVKIIFISGYDDFEAARNAIALNAFAYLLKPIKMTELLICVRKAAGLHRKEKERHQEEIMLKKQLDESMPLLRMKYLHDLYQTVEETGEEDILQRGTFLGLPIEAGKYCIVVAMIDSFRAFSMNRGVEEIQMELIKITNAIKESVRETSDYPIVATREGEFTLLFRFTSILNEDEIMQHVETIGREIRDAVNQCSQLSVTLGVSMISKDVTGFSRMYIQARRIVDQRFYLGTNRLLWYDEERFIDRRTISDVSRVQEQMEEAINSMDSQEVRKVINNYFSVLLSSNSENREYVQSICMELVSTAIRILHERNESMESILGPGVSPWIKLMEFDTILDIRNWMTNCLVAITEYLFDQRMNQNEEITDQIKHLIHQQYMNNLTVEDIASQVFLSAGYIRRKFKNKTGMTIQDFLTQYRMQKAAELIRNTQDKIYMIAERVGYSHPSYFTAVFREYYGVTPGEYKNGC